METAAKRILIIEDEPALRNVLNDALTSGGFSCTTSADGESGLEAAIATRPDLILLDLLLPKMDGMTMLSKLRKDPWGATAVVLILTNLSVDQSDLVQAIVENYPEYYIIKSNWSIQGIVEKARQMLNLR